MGKPQDFTIAGLQAVQRGHVFVVTGKENGEKAECGNTKTKAVRGNQGFEFGDEKQLFMVCFYNTTCQKNIVHKCVTMI